MVVHGTTVARRGRSWLLGGLLAASVAAAQGPEVASLAVAERPPASPGQTLALAQTYRERGDWFRLMPHFNRDSTLFFYGKLLTLLDGDATRPPAEKAEVYAHLADYHRRYNDFEKARKLADRAWVLSEQGGASPTVRYGIRMTQARLELTTGDPKKALALLRNGIALVQADDSPLMQARVLGDKGMFYGKYNEGLEAQADLGMQDVQRSLALYESFNNPAAYALELSDRYRELIWYHNVKMNSDSCEFYFQKLHRILPVLRWPTLYTWYFAQRGNHLSRRGRYAEARPLIQRCLDITEQYHLQFATMYPYSLNLMGVVAQETGRYDEALDYFTRSRDASLKINIPNVQRDYLYHMLTLHEKKGDYRAAFAYATQWADEREQAARDFSVKSLRENELEVNLLKKENELARRQAERRSFITAIAGTVLVALLLGVVLFGLYRRNRTKQQTNQQLATLNADLARKNAQLDKRNAENELLLKEIHHRVKNNLEVVSSLLELQSARLDDPDLQQAMLASQNRVQSMGILHQKLYQSEHLAFIEMKQYFVNLSENILDSYNAADRVTVQCEMPELELDVDTAVPVGLIVNELLTNALKYAFPRGGLGRVWLSLEEISRDVLQLRIADNGVGKPAGATAQGTGFGTQLVELLTRQLDGTLRQEVSGGTVISIQFKKHRLA